MSPTPGRYEPSDTPATYPLTLAEAKKHLNVNSTASAVEDEINALLASATEACEDYMRRRIMSRTIRFFTACFPCGPIVLEQLPVQSIDTVAYYAVDGTLIEESDPSAAFQCIAGKSDARILPLPGQSWPPTQDDRAEAVIVEFTAGYESAAKVPASMKAAVRLKLGHLYRNREEVITGTIAAEMPNACKSLLDPYRDLRFV